MMVENFSEPKFDSMRLFCSLARKLEHSGTAMFNYLNHDDFDEPKFCEEGCELDKSLAGRYSHCGTIPLKFSELSQLHQKLKLLSDFVGLDEMETLLLVACLTKEMENKSGWNEADILGFFSFRYTDYMVLTPVFARMVKSGVFVSAPSDVFGESTYMVNRELKEKILSEK
ncbi:MAG: hypothetical protein II815_11360 [Bacteroidales bacterium]|nr:hypothetical protein [Bacteroidales bacterium]